LNYVELSLLVKSPLNSHFLLVDKNLTKLAQRLTFFVTRAPLCVAAVPPSPVASRAAEGFSTSLKLGMEDAGSGVTLW
jgi:hypothetical protein